MYTEVWKVCKLIYKILKLFTRLLLEFWIPKFEVHAIYSENNHSGLEDSKK